jgi:hypothetical protein
MAKRVIGRITMQFVQHDGGRWHCEVRMPRLHHPREIRNTYKMALVTAVLQDHVNKTLANIDKMIMNNAEIAEYQNMQVQEERNKASSDIDKYQTKLPFKHEGY